MALSQDRLLNERMV